MEFPFYKLHIFGNDLILVNTIGQEAFNKQVEYMELSLAMCNRHTGIGANGVLFIRKGINHPVAAEYYNAGGELAFSYDMLLCLARYIFDTGIYGKDRIEIEAGTEVWTIDVIDSNNFKINMGIPVVNGTAVEPVENLDLFSSVQIDGKKLFTLPVDMKRKGNYFYAPGMNRPDLKKLAQNIYARQPRKEYEQAVFILPVSMHSAEFFSWFPRCCVDISNAAAIAYAGAIIQGVAGSEITMVHNDYEFFMDWVGKSGEIQLTGAGTYVFTGNWYTENNE